MEVQFLIRFVRPDGVVISREATLRSSSTYGARESKADFIRKSRRQINAALTSVLGASPDLKIEREV